MVGAYRYVYIAHASTCTNVRAYCRLQAQRADEKDEQVKLTEKLDLQLPELTPLLQHRPTRASRTADDEEPDEFDKLVREMANDARSRVTDRLRTEDEIAKKEAERLQKLEVRACA